MWRFFCGLLFFLFGVTAGLAAPTAQDTKRRPQDAIKETQSALGSIQGNLLGNQAIEHRVRAGYQNSGEWGAFEAYFKQQLGHFIGVSREYQQVMETIGWNAILDPIRIQQDKNFKGSRQIIVAGREAMKAYRKKQLDIIEETRLGLIQLKMNRATHEQVIRFANTDFKRVYEVCSEKWDLEDKIMHEVETLITLLHQHQNRWQVRGKQIVFSSPADFKRWQASLARIDDYNKQQESLQRQSLKRSVNALGQILKP